MYAQKCGAFAGETMEKEAQMYALFPEVVLSNLACAHHSVPAASFVIKSNGSTSAIGLSGQRSTIEQLLTVKGEHLGREDFSLALFSLCSFQ